MATIDPDRPRLRDLGVTIGTMAAGPLNAITDVTGVRVGHTTVIHGEAPLRPGTGPARTGVTAVRPHQGSAFRSLVPAAIEVLNGAGEITGRSQIEEYGLLESPILITNTLSVGVVHQACVEWLCREEPALGTQAFSIPVVAETFDGYLNDICGQHVTREHVWSALDDASSGRVAEGNVGGGTDMRLFGYKGGIGTASRIVNYAGKQFSVGVLAQGNFGTEADLVVDGVPVGRELAAEGDAERSKDGSVIVVIATDAPLSDRQLRRLCKRGSLGLGRTGAAGRHSSGDLLLAFSNAQENHVERFGTDLFQRSTHVRDSNIDEFFVATIEATEEAVLNALIAAETMVGRNGHIAEAISHGRLIEIIRRHGRITAR